MERKDIDEINEKIEQINNAIKSLESSSELRNTLENISRKVTLTATNAKLNSLRDAYNAYIVEAREEEKLSEKEFDDKYIKVKKECENLGRLGWVVTQYSNPREITQWVELVREGKYKDIADYFDEQLIDTLVNDLQLKYKNMPESTYFDKGIFYYNQNDYMTSAIYICALIDKRCKTLIDFGNYRKNKVKYSNIGFERHLHNQFYLTNSTIKKRFLFVQMYPSLIAFLYRLFVEEGENDIDKGTEPDYINRNWILHGHSTRIIERYECIQLINALNVLEFVCRVNNFEEN